MSESLQSTRLGDLLIDKGKISHQHVSRAIQIQQQRREDAERAGVAPPANTELGEILIELGCISREQLRSSLSWQKRLRKTTLAMSFIAPLLTTACGGGGGGEVSAPKVQTTQTTVSSVQNNPSSIAANSSAMALSSSFGSLVNSSQNNISSTSTNSNKIIVVSSQASSLSASSNSSKMMQSSSTVSSAVSSLKSSSSSASVSGINGPVLLNWTPPTQRENGDYLDIAEVGGYQLRYKLKNQSQYTNILIENGYTDSYYFNNMTGDYVFEIAAFDKNGLYSDFVKVDSL